MISQAKTFSDIQLCFYLWADLRWSFQSKLMCILDPVKINVDVLFVDPLWEKVKGIGPDLSSSEWSEGVWTEEEQQEGRAGIKGGCEREEECLMSLYHFSMFSCDFSALMLMYCYIKPMCKIQKRFYNLVSELSKQLGKGRVER